MQENNFEKQVQQKMDELSLTPSVPVWQNVQRDIRKKKEKRRLIIWAFPTLILLLTGTLWLLKNQHSDLPVVNPSATSHSVKDRERSEQQIDKEGKNKSIIAIQEDALSADQNIKENKTGNPVIGKSNQLPQRVTYSKKASDQRAIVNSKPKHQAFQISLAIRKEHKTNTKLIKDNTKKQQEELLSISPTLNASETEVYSTAVDTQKETVTISNETELPVVDTVNHQSTEQNIREEIALIPDNIDPKQSSTKRSWIWTAHAAFGRSSAKEHLFSGMTKSMESISSLSPTTNFQPANATGAPARKGMAYSIGTGVKTSLSKRFSLTAGLQYSYFSTRDRIGNNVVRDTVIQRNNAFLINSFFQRGQNRDYINKYHFIEIPIGLEWQLHQKLPLYLNTGLSFNRMVATNALIYDRTAGIYYEDTHSLQRNQVHAFTNLSYRFLNRKKINIQAGPYLQYGLNSLQKENASDRLHLFSSGLRTSFSFL